MSLFEKEGPHNLGRRTGVSLKCIYARRRSLESKYQRQITAPGITTTRRGIQHPGRLHIDVLDGIVLIGSDGHYWDGPPSVAHRAFVKFCKEMKPKAVVMNGDAMDGAKISRHTPINWEDRPDVVDELKAVQLRLGEMEEAAPANAKLTWNLGNHDCLDTETECLTKRGWLRFHDISPDDVVLSLSSNGVCEWSRINEIVSFPFGGELIRVEKTRMSMAMTPNHRVLLKRLNWRSKKYDILEYRRADDLPSSFDLPVTGQIMNDEYNIPDDMIALAGWVLTDGHIDKVGNVSLYQSKPQGIEEISGILSRLSFSYSRYERQRERRAICGRELLSDPLPSVQFFIHANASREIKEWVPYKGKLPAWAQSLSARQFQILLDALIAGDGVWDGNPENKTCAVLYGVESILSSVQEAAVCHGWRARVSTDNRGHYRLCLSREPKLRIEKPEIYSEPYKGTVWCLRVPHGNFMVRRNGCAFFTGNSRFETRLAHTNPEYARIHGFHLKDHFGARWLPAWSTWINNNVVVKHRIAGGMHATRNNVLRAGMTVITGHLHSLQVRPLSDYHARPKWGVDSGMLANPYGPQFAGYTEDNPVDWRSGFIVLTFHKGVLLWPEIVHAYDDDHVEFRGEIIKC